MKEILKGLFKIKNKIHLGSLFLISVLCLLPSFSEAGNDFIYSLSDYTYSISTSTSTTYTVKGPICYMCTSSNYGKVVIGNTDYNIGQGVYCYNGESNIKFTSRYSYVQYYLIDYNEFNNYFSSSCDYSGYVAESDITQNYCTTKFNTLITQTNCDSQYNGYITQSNCDSQYNGYITQSNCDSQYSGYILESSVNQNYCVNNNLCPSSSCDYSGYILESSVNQSYCENHGLCPICPTCPSGSGEVSWSSLYINNIQHLGGPNIHITIPQEISWDYEYDSNDDFNLSIKGYNVDYDYMDSIVNTQTYTPDSEDFTSIITNIIPKFVPGLVIILFIYFVFRFIKKIF